jgi:hypothetical protein
MSKYFVVFFALLLTTMVLWCRCSIEAMQSDTLMERIQVELKAAGYADHFQSEIHADTVNVLATREDKTIDLLIIHHKDMRVLYMTKGEYYPPSKRMYNHSFSNSKMNTL